MDSRHEPPALDATPALDALLRDANDRLLHSLDDTIDVAGRLRDLKAAISAPAGTAWMYELMATERGALVGRTARLLAPPLRRWRRSAPDPDADRNRRTAERIVDGVYEMAREQLPDVRPRSKTALRLWLTHQVLVQVNLVLEFQADTKPYRRPAGA